MSEHDLAARTVAGMFARDRASQLLGMEVVETGPGRSTVRMAVRPDMLNGFGIIHGGLTFALADSALAFACNSYGELTVASGAVIDFLAPAREGDVLTAQAQEVSRTKRTGVYDIEVTNQDGLRVAVFRGRSYVIVGKPSVPESGAE